MEGARILAAEARRKDLRFPFQKDFVARLQGQTVTGLGRRAKYLMADLGSGDVLLMHLGMSGSFRVIRTDGQTMPGQFHHARGKDEAEVTVVKVDVRPELKSTVTASGEVRPIRFVNLTSEVQGRNRA